MFIRSLKNISPYILTCTVNHILKSKKNKYYLSICVILRFLTLSLSSANSISNSNKLLVSIDQYINTSENNSDQNIYYDVDKTFKVGSSQNVKVEMNLNWSQNENYLYPHLSNLYYEIKSAQLSFGLKRITWSETMDFFKSNEWQQQLERNKLNPRTGGNLGVFYSTQFQNLKFDVMYSPYFLPSRGPDIDFKNGLAESENPWFNKPPEEVPYAGNNLPTYYQIKEPDLSELLNQQSFALKLNAIENQKWILNMAYANKPSPKIVTDFNFSLKTIDSGRVDVLIEARSVRHQLLSADLSYLISKNTKAMVAYMNERFEPQDLESTGQTFMNPNDQTNYSFLMTHKTKRYELSWGGILRNGGGSTFQGEIANALVNQNINYIYQRAIKFDFTYFKSWGWTLNTSFSYDFLQKGFLTSALFQRQISNAVVNFGFDALEPVDASDQSSFIYQYRNLDRVWAGISYVF